MRLLRWTNIELKELERIDRERDGFRRKRIGQFQVNEVQMNFRFGELEHSREMLFGEKETLRAFLLLFLLAQESWSFS